MKSYPQMQMDLESGLETYAGDMPKLMEAFTGILDEATAPGTLDRKTKELVALAISAVVRCNPCIAHHVKAVREAGASRSEIAEVLGVAVLMGGGPALAYSVAAMQAFEQFEAADAIRKSPSKSR